MCRGQKKQSFLTKQTDRERDEGRPVKCDNETAKGRLCKNKQNDKTARAYIQIEGDVCNGKITETDGDGQK